MRRDDPGRRRVAILQPPDNEVERVGGVTYTVKDGVVYDAKKLLADVRKLVADAKQKENFEITQPGVVPKPGKVSSGKN